MPAKHLTVDELRDYILRAYEMAGGNYVQSDTEMRRRIAARRIAALLKKAIDSDDAMLGTLGYGGPDAWRDVLKQ